MLKVSVRKVDVGGIVCQNKNCKKLPEYNFNIIGNNFHMKQGSYFAMVSLEDFHYKLYCEGCFEEINKEAKIEIAKLDKKLWILK